MQNTYTDYVDENPTINDMKNNTASEVYDDEKDNNIIKLYFDVVDGVLFKWHNCKSKCK